MNQIYSQKLKEFYACQSFHPDYFLILYPEYPFRPDSLLCDLYLQAIQTSSDLTFVAYEDQLLKKSHRFFNTSSSSHDDLVPCPGLGLVVKYESLLSGLNHSTLKKSHLVLSDTQSRFYTLGYEQLGSVVRYWSKSNPNDE